MAQCSIPTTIFLRNTLNKSPSTFTTFSESTMKEFLLNPKSTIITEIEMANLDFYPTINQILVFFHLN